ncbi:MAG: hypothetical protein ACM31L_15840 [Actinomycetota bacterium]
MLDIPALARIALVSVLLLGTVSLMPRRRAGLFAAEVEARTILLLGIAWVLAVTLEFWILGPASFVNFGDEGAQALPYYIHLAEHAPPGRYDFRVMGGVDALAIFSSGYQLASIERLLFAWLSPWLATAVHKVAAEGLALAGAYLLARAAAPVNRPAALGIAAVYTLATQYVIEVTLAHGFGYHVQALAVLVLCYRTQARTYLLEAAAMAVAVAVSILPVQGGMGFYTAVGLTALLGGAWRRPRFYAALALMLPLHVLNWAGIMAAMAGIAPLTSRVQLFAPPLDIGGELTLSQLLVPAVAIAVSLGIAVFRRQPASIARQAALLLGPALVAVVLDTAPWDRIGLGFVKGVNPSYVLFAWLPLAVVSLAEAVAGLKPALERGAPAARLLAAALCCGLPLGLAAHYKVYNGLYWLGFGGHSALHGIPNLVRPTWLPDEPVRAVAVAHHLSDNNLLAYGIETAGGYFMLFDARKNAFWQQAGRVMAAGRLGLKVPERSCPGVQKLADLGNARLLRIANIRYLVSTLPVEGAGLTQVSGPDPAKFRPSCTMAAGEKLASYWRRLLAPEDAYVYDLGAAVPRVYFARSVAQPQRFGTPEYWRAVEEVGEAQGIVPETGAELNGASAATARVTKASVAGDGMEIEVDAPAGGVLVINSSWLPFFRATADGVPVTLVPVNGVQMAAALPAGARSVKVEYVRRLPVPAG